MKKIHALLSLILICFIILLCGCGTEDTSKDKYYFALINSEYMTAEDTAAVSRIVKSYENHDVFTVDVKGLTTAIEVYELLREESLSKNAILDGIQIFGTSDMVPSFVIDSKTVIRQNGEEAFETYRSFFSDYFYSNFDNDATLLQGFNIADNFASDKRASLAPDWPVVRLPLGSGEFSGYVDNYDEYLTKKQGVKPQLVCFSSPSFSNFNVTVGNDVAYFLQRAKDEWHIIDSVNIYTNQLGITVSPVTALGDIGIKPFAKKNRNGVCEFFIVGHGSQNGVKRTYFTEDNKEYREDYITYDQISTTFRSNPYYMITHSCQIAEGLDYNFARTALNNGCLGIFATTTGLANNGIDCRVSLDDMQATGNYFYFYYLYFDGLNNGLSRAHAFFEAQKEYELILQRRSTEELDYSKNYQHVYQNLISYANLGIMEPDTATIPFADIIEDTEKAIPLGREHIHITSGAETNDAVSLTVEFLEGVKDNYTEVPEARAVHLDNDHVRFYFTVKTKVGTAMYLLSSNDFYLRGIMSYYTYAFDNELVLVIDVPKEELEKQGDMYLHFENSTTKGASRWQVHGIDKLKNSQKE